MNQTHPRSAFSSLTLQFFLPVLSPTALDFSPPVLEFDKKPVGQVIFDTIKIQNVPKPDPLWFAIPPHWFSIFIDYWLLITGG